jgi:hypothetical protein
MTVARIKTMRERAPFRPFQLHLSNGETLPILHPESLAIAPDSGTQLFVVWVGIHWNLIDAAHVVRLSLLNSKSKQSKG